MRKWTMMAVLALVAGYLTGCGKPEETVSSDPPPEPVPPMQILGAELQALDEAGDTNGVVARLNAALTDETFAEHAITLMGWILGYELRLGRVEDALGRYHALVVSAPEKALPLVEIIPNYYRAQGNETGLVAWCEQLIAAPGAESLKPPVWRLAIASLARQGRYADVQERLPAVLALGEVSARDMLAEVLRQALHDKAYADALRLATALEPLVEPGGQLATLVVLTRIDVMLGQARLEEAESLLLSQAASLKDRDLAGRLVRLLRAADEAGKGEQVSRIAVGVLDEMTGRTSVRDQIGRLWVQLAVDAQDPAAFLVRAAKALDAGLTPPRMAQIVESGFYLVMQTGDMAQREAGTKLVARALALDGLSDDQRESLLMRQLDAAFYRNDFKAAATVVEGGIPNHDETWHAELLDKIAAHVALGEGRHADAIKLFRKHMATVARWEEPVKNPENGNLMTKEVVLGFNEKRLGDIYTGMDGHGDDAQAAYRRAREWYGKALDLLKPDSPEYAQAQAELSTVPGK